MRVFLGVILELMLLLFYQYWLYWRVVREVGVVLEPDTDVGPVEWKRNERHDCRDDAILVVVELFFDGLAWWRRRKREREIRRKRWTGGGRIGDIVVLEMPRGFVCDIW